MKTTLKATLLLLAFISAGIFAKAQNTAKDVFSKDEIVWYGFDFSKAKFVGETSQAGDAGKLSGGDIKTKYMPAWNMLVINESEKYDLKKTFRKNSVFKDLDPVMKSNAKIDVDNLTTYNDYKFDNAENTVQSIVSSYIKGDKADGVGVVIIAEAMNKGEKKASVYVTFFDIATKKVLFYEHMNGKPGGIGFKNFWAGAIRNILVEIDGSYWKSWKSSYSK